MFKYLLLAFFWTFFFALHSLLANSKVKLLAKNLFRNHYKYYRIGFNLISILFFLLIILFQFSIEKIFLFTPQYFFYLLGAIIFIGGLIAMYYAFKAFNTKEFIGVQQLQEINKSKEVMHLTKTDFYGLVRHPLYFATILLILGAFIALPTLANAIFLLAVFTYLPVGIYLEEKKLIMEFGDEYKQYQKEVKAVVPFLF